MYLDVTWTAKREAQVPKTRRGGHSRMLRFSHTPIDPHSHCGGTLEHVLGEGVGDLAVGPVVELPGGAATPAGGR